MGSTPSTHLEAGTQPHIHTSKKKKKKEKKPKMFKNWCGIKMQQVMQAYGASTRKAKARLATVRTPAWATQSSRAF